MRSGIITVFVLIIIGVMFAEAVTNPAGVKVGVDGFIKFWQTSINGLLGKTS